MSERQSGHRGDDTVEIESPDSSGDESVVRVLVAICAGAVLTAALVFAAVEVGNLDVPMQGFVGLGGAIGGGVGAVLYLLRNDETVTPDHDTRPDAANATASPDAPAPTDATASPDATAPPGEDATAAAPTRTDLTDSASPETPETVDETASTPDAADETPASTDLFQVHPDPILRVTERDESVLVTGVNPAFEETFGVSESTLGGAPLDEATMTEDGDDIAARLRENGSIDETVTCETVSGRVTFWLRAIATDTDPSEFYLVYTGVDEAAGRSDERVEELASVVSHELRNPLDSARARIDAARDTGDTEHYDTALRNLDRISRIIDDLTTLAREGQLVEEREPVDLDAAVQSVWRTVDPDDDVASLSVVDDLGTIEADAGPLDHLLENLVRNAVEHSEDSVAVTVGRLPDGFYVADDGPGIPENRHSDVFEAGFTTDRQGTGLGLRIVERVAEAHGWDVAVTDSESGGARFEITGVDRIMW